MSNLPYEADSNILFPEPDASYQYFSLPEITKDFNITEDTVKKAKKLADTNRVELSDVKVGYTDRDTFNDQICIVDGTYESESNTLYSVSAVLSHTEVLQMRCMVPRCNCYYNKYGFYYAYDFGEISPCKHIASLMLLTREYQKEHMVGDATDYMANVMFDAFEDLRDNKSRSSDGTRQTYTDVSLAPRLSYEKDSLQLSFKIGKDKMFVLKNMRQLIKTYEDGGVFRLGKTAEIDFSTAKFTDTSEQYLEFIEREINQEDEHQRRLLSNHRNWYLREGDLAENITSSISLYGSRFDDFFEIVKDTTVPFADKALGRKDVPALVKEGNISVQLNINPVFDGNGQFQSVELTGEAPDVINGAKYRYLIDREAPEICRINTDSGKQFNMLSRISENGLVNVHIGRGRLNEFYRLVLPKLRECADITDNARDEIADFLPKDVEFKFYLDANDGIMSCHTVAVYDEEEYSVLDFLMSDSDRYGFRDTIREEETCDVAMKYFPNISGEENKAILVSTDDDDAYRILDEGVPALMELGEVHCTDNFKNRKIRHRVKVSVGISVKSDIMELEVSSDNLSPRELLDILESYRLKKRYHKLKNGDFVDISDDSISELVAMMDTMRISPKEFTRGKMHLPLYRAIYLDKMLESCQEIYASRDRYFRNLVKNFKTVADSDYEAPENLKKVLRNYQKYGYKWLRVLCDNKFGGILADDMGLGKTVQLISLLSATKDEVAKPSLIVCPASLVYNWQSEFDKFAPQLTTTVVVGTQTERKKIISDTKENDILITSYDLLKRDISEYEDIEFEYQVIDEAQYIKTHTTATAKSVKVIKAAHKFALTGTPIENRLSELWSIFDYLMPGFLYSYDVFKKEIESPIVKQKDEEVTKRLRRMVSPFVLRRLKKDVLKDLPDKIEELQYARMENEQQILYDAQVTHMKEILNNADEESFNKDKIKILAELTRIRQICCDPSLIFDNYGDGSAKRDACMDLIESAIEGEHKMLVFSQFTSMLDILAAELGRRGIGYYTITGSTPKEKRIELVNSFNTNDVPVFLISLKAGGTGLNLTGADVVIHYDPWWNVAAQNQATDRAHRIGQTRVVSVYKLIVKGSIEEKIIKMQQDKADLADSILAGNSESLTKMTREDLLALL